MPTADPSEKASSREPGQRVSRAKRLSVQRFEAKIQQFRTQIRQLEREQKVLERERRAALDIGEQYLSVVPTEDEMIAALVRRNDRYADAVDRILAELNRNTDTPRRLAEFLDGRDLEDHHHRAEEDEPGGPDPDRARLQREFLLAQNARFEQELRGHESAHRELEELRELVADLRKQTQPVEVSGAQGDLAILAEQCVSLRSDLDIARNAIDLLADERRALVKELAASEGEREQLAAKLASVIREVDAKLESASAAGADAGEREELRARLEVAEGQRAELRQDNEMLVTRLAEAQAKAGAAAKAQKEMAGLLEQLQAARGALAGQREAFEALTVEAAEDKKAVEAAREELARQEQAVAGLGRDLEGRTRELQETRSGLDAVAEERGRLEQNLKELEGRRTEAREHEEQVRREQEAMREAMRKQEEEARQLREDRELLQGRAEQSQSAVKETAKERKRVSEELRRSREQAQALSEKVSELDTELRRSTRLIESTQEKLAAARRHEAQTPASAAGPPPLEIRGVELLDVIGSGPNATVYTGRKTGRDRILAFKADHSAFIHVPAFLDGLDDVLPRLARLESPYIMRQLSLGRMGNVAPIAMDHLPGGNLLDAVAKGPMSEEDALTMAHQVALALDAALGADIMHRNIKPTNILFAEDGTVRLSDFTIVSRESDGTVLLPGGQLAYYGPPEVLRGLQDVDVRTDIYGIGAVLYHALTGAPPVAAANMPAILLQMQSKGAPWPKRGHLESDAALHLVAHLMARQRADRPATLSDVLTDIELVFEGQFPAAGRCEPGTSVVRVPD